MSEKQSLDLSDVTGAFTCCLYPKFTIRAIDTFREYYPDVDGVVVIDGCNGSIGNEKLAQKHAAELIMLKRKCVASNVEVVELESRMGAGVALDTACANVDTPLMLTIDHGIRLHERGLIELYLERLNSDTWEEIVCIGPVRGRNKKCCRAFGPYVDPVLGLFNAEWILENGGPDNGLTFKLTHVRLIDDLDEEGNAWQVIGCSTAQFLQYRAMALGARQSHITFRTLDSFTRHKRTPRTRARAASPHELMKVETEYLKDRIRDKDGDLLYNDRVPVDYDGSR